MAKLKIILYIPEKWVGTNHISVFGNSTVASNFRLNDVTRRYELPFDSFEEFAAAEKYLRPAGQAACHYQILTDIQIVDDEEKEKPVVAAPPAPAIVPEPEPTPEPTPIKTESAREGEIRRMTESELILYCTEQGIKVKDGLHGNAEGMRKAILITEQLIAEDQANPKAPEYHGPYDENSLSALDITTLRNIADVISGNTNTLAPKQKGKVIAYIVEHKS